VVGSSFLGRLWAIADLDPKHLMFASLHMYAQDVYKDVHATQENSGSHTIQDFNSSLQLSNPHLKQQ